MDKLPLPCLMLLTDRTRLSPNWTLAQAVAPAITGGCNAVVFRETDLPFNHRTTVARFVVDGVKGRAPLLVSDDAGLAESIGAQGVHVSTLPDGRTECRGIIGMSVRSRDEAEQAVRLGADYLLIEYEWSHPERVLDHFRALREGITAPIIVGTDMPVDSAGRLMEAGATGLAICEPAMSAYDRTSACRAYADALRGGGV